MSSSSSSSSLVGQSLWELGLHGFTCFFLLAVSVLLLARHLTSSTRSKANLPPSPPSLPIIGNLHQLGSLPHRSLHRLALTHGPIMHLRLGHIPTLVVSSPDAVKAILKTHDLAFCSRPPLVARHKLSYGRLDLAFSPYGEYWRQVRRLSMTSLFNAKQAQSFRPIREEEVHTLVRAIAGSAGLGPVNLSEMLLCLLNNITFREVFGKRASKDGDCGRSEFHGLISETIALMGGFCAGDFFPSMKWLNVLTGMEGRLDRCFREMDGFLENRIEEARQLGHDECFATILLKLQDDPALGVPLSKDHIKAILMVTFVAGTDTAAVSLVWTMVELMRSPRVMAKALQEVRRVAAGKEKLDESDLHNLKYLKLVVKETLRLHPPGPLLLPRESREDCNIAGYDIPAGTRVYINAWAIGRDPDQWKDPEVFWPERFEDSNIDYKGQHFELVPFGGGRRICPGLPLAEATVELTLAALLLKFDWSMPEGTSRDEIDMGECFGVVVSKKVPLVLVATPAGPIEG